MPAPPPESEPAMVSSRGGVAAMDLSARSAARTGGVGRSGGRRSAASARPPAPPPWRRTARLMSWARVRPWKKRSSLARSSSMREALGGEQSEHRQRDGGGGGPAADHRHSDPPDDQRQRRLVELGGMDRQHLAVGDAGRHVDPELGAQVAGGGGRQPAGEAHPPRQVGGHAVVVADQEAADRGRCRSRGRGPAWRRRRCARAAGAGGGPPTEWRPARRRSRRTRPAPSGRRAAASRDRGRRSRPWRRRCRRSSRRRSACWRLLHRRSPGREGPSGAESRRRGRRAPSSPRTG